MDVPKSTFYSYTKHAAQNMVAHMYGNSSLRKPRAHTIHATATLDYILDKYADPMSYRSPILTFGKKVVAKVLLGTWKWKKTILELNKVNTSFGLKEVLLSNVSKIRWCSFEEYDAKRPRDNFAQYSSCDKYYSLYKLPQSST